jgi:hypothetical protein
LIGLRFFLVAFFISAFIFPVVAPAAIVALEEEGLVNFELILEQTTTNIVAALSLINHGFAFCFC